MKYVLIAMLFALLPLQGSAGFGGSRSSSRPSPSYSRPSPSYSRPTSSFGGNRSAPSPSYSRPTPTPSTPSRSWFGGNRASNSGPATITRPAPAPSAPVYVAPSHTTVVVRDNSGSGFWSGMMWGSLLSHNNQPTVVNNNYDANGQPQQAYVQQQDSGHGFFFWVFVLLVVGGIGLAIVKLL